MKPSVNTDLQKSIENAVADVGDALVSRGWSLATAESCTGGWIAKCCTDVVGSSEWFDRAYIAYSYRAKEQMLCVSNEDLLKHGAVSAEIARQMAIGAKQHSKAAVAVSATGIAGPGGGMPGKPVGLVHFGWCINDQPVDCGKAIFSGDRNEVRQQTVLYALEGIIYRLD